MFGSNSKAQLKLIITVQVTQAILPSLTGPAGQLAFCIFIALSKSEWNFEFDWNLLLIVQKYFCGFNFFFRITFVFFLFLLGQILSQICFFLFHFNYFKQSVLLTKRYK